MNNDRGPCHPDPRRAGDGAGLSPRRNATDPEGLAIAREMQERLQPAKVILLGSRAVGDHRDDSDVDLMAVAPDEAAAAAKETLRNLLDGKYDVPVVNVITITREEFRRTAPLAQSWAGQAARHGVTPGGRSLGYQPERDPTAEEIRQATIFWLTLAEARLDAFSLTSENGQLSWSHIPAFEGQTALERAFKGLLTAGNDEARFRRDASIMWRHTESTRPIADRKGASTTTTVLETTEWVDQPAQPSSGNRSSAFSYWNWGVCHPSANRRNQPCRTTGHSCGTMTKG